MYHLVNSVGSPKNLYMIVSGKKKERWPSIIPMLYVCLTSLQYEKRIGNISTASSAKVN